MTLPYLGLLAGHSDTGPLVPLFVALRTWSRLHAVDRTLGSPDAYVATDPSAIGLDAALAGPLPVAVFVDSPSALPDSIRDRADVLIVRDKLAADERGDEYVIYPRDCVRASDHPPISPFVRSRWRRSLGLADTLIVRLGFPDPWPVDDTAIPAALAVCSVAIVRGPWLLTALALGTPVVTDPTSAERVGAIPHVHLAVSSEGQAATTASDLASDSARATALGWGARLLVEEHHDLGTVAIRVLEQLGLGPACFPLAPLAGLDAELAALGTPDDSPVAIRALRRAMGIAGAADWADLTGRRR